MPRCITKGEFRFLCLSWESYGLSGSKNYKVGKIGCKIRIQCLTCEGNFGLVLIIRSIEKLRIPEMRVLIQYCTFR